MNRTGRVLYDGEPCGVISETDDGYLFSYDDAWLAKPDAQPVSLTMPLTQKEYTSQSFFSFFDGLIPEGWLLEVSARNWKLDPRDRMGLLLTVCRDCIGAVSVVTMEVTGE
jgi:serine/threonine-protein kinase HipA